MGNCVQSEEQKRHKKIEDALGVERKRLRSEIKLLLLGPGESGKSTVFKQMHIIEQNGGFSDKELMGYKYIVYANCITQMRALCLARQKFGVPLADPANQVRAQRMCDISPGGDKWSLEVAEDIGALWADVGVRQTYDHRDRGYQLNDSAAYFFENVVRFSNERYMPNEQDVLRARVRSTGIQESHFQFDDMGFKMLDVGGQRSERRKWIHCFDAVTAVIFCVAMSEYDQTLREEESQNRMKESLLLFEEICNSHWFKQTPFVLFLNKIDLFKEKIEKGFDMKDHCFPQYSGGCNFETAADYVRTRFLEVNNSPHTIYTHFTCAIQTQNIEFVFKCVRETVLKNILWEIGPAM